jgi:aspartate aminotransferase
MWLSRSPNFTKASISDGAAYRNTRLMPHISARQSAIPQAATMQAAARARALRAEGRDIISLTLGEPDFATPRHAIEAAHAAALRGDTKYPAVGGSPAFKSAIRAKFLRDSNLEFAPEDILVGNGARQIIYDALTATLDAGDEIIIPAPYWNAYPLIAQMAGATPVFIDCPDSENFLPTPQSIACAITPRTTWLVLNFPNNPTGAVCPERHLHAIAEILRAAPHVWIMADDMYEHLIHDGTRNPTMAAIAPDLADRVLTISGVSKTYAMTGWRVGFAGGPRHLIEAMAKVQGQTTGGVSPIAQAAATAALEGPQDLVADMRAAYAARSRRVAAALTAIDGITCHAPQGAFYCYPSIAGLLGRTTRAGTLIDTDAAFCAALLEEAGVATVHGAAFGKSPHLRLSTAASDDNLATACVRIAAFCDTLR